MRLVSALLLVALPAVAAPFDVAGEWDISVERPANWTPRTAHARLTLTRTGRRWEGSIQFETLMNGQRMRLADIRVTGKRVWFRWDVERFTVTMEAKLTDGGLRGVCAWKGTGTWPFRGKRAQKAKPQRRFDDGGGDFLAKVEPETVGADPAALDRLIQAASECDTDALIVIKDGKLICERYFKGYRGRVHIMSVTKFVTSLAVAKLLERKKLKLDDPVSKWFPEWKAGEKAKVTVRDLMAHTSGLQHERQAHTLNKQTDKVKHVRALPVKDPGKTVRYSNEGIALLSGILTAAAGKPVDAYLKETLFAPMMIRDWKWDRDEAGNTITYAQLYMTARDLARLAMLPPVPAFMKPGKEKHRGLIWRLYSDPRGYGHTGWLGQSLVVYPDQALIGIRLRRATRNTDTQNQAHEFGAFPARLGDLAR